MVRLKAKGKKGIENKRIEQAVENGKTKQSAHCPDNDVNMYGKEAKSIRHWHSQGISTRQ